MTEIIHKRIDELSKALTQMNDTYSEDRRETYRLMEKLVDGQNALNQSMAEKTAYDRSVEKRLSSIGNSLKEVETAVVDIKIETSANTDMRKSIQKQRSTVFGIIAGILITGALFAYTLGKGS